MIDTFKLKLVLKTINEVKTSFAEIKKGQLPEGISFSMISHVEVAVDLLKKELESNIIPPKPRQDPITMYIIDSWPLKLKLTNDILLIGQLYCKL